MESLSLSASPPAQLQGQTRVTLTADAVGNDPIAFCFMYSLDGGATWTVEQLWGSSNTYEFFLPLGDYPDAYLGCWAGQSSDYIPKSIKWPISPAISIPARQWHSTEYFASETLCVEQNIDLAADATKIGLVAIDVWNSHPNTGWFDRVTANLPKTVDLVEAFRLRKLPIFHAPSDVTENSQITANWGETDYLLTNWPTNLATMCNYIDQMSLTHLFWCGYAANMCVLTKPAGFIAVAQARLNLKCSLVRDCTIGFEMADTLADQRMLDWSVRFCESVGNGFSATSGDVKSAIGVN